MTTIGQTLAVTAVRRRRIPSVALLSAAIFSASCSAGPSESAAPPTASPALDVGHVHGVGVDPADESLVLATHTGLFRVAAGGEAELVGPVMDLMGFTVVGPGHFLASGHPGLHVDLPQPMGLIESTDGGRSWNPVSRQGESDFHALTASSTGVLGYDGVLRRSSDGRHWEQLAIPSEPHGLAASPDGQLVLATTAEGLLRSADAGRSWSAVAGAPLLQVVAWADDGMETAGVDPSGRTWFSSDGGVSWAGGAALGAAPQAVAISTGADGASRVVVVTTAGVVASEDGGRTFADVLSQ